MIGYCPKNEKPVNAFPGVDFNVLAQHFPFFLLNNSVFSFFPFVRTNTRPQQPSQMIIEDDRQISISSSLNSKEPRQGLLNVDELVQQGRMYDQDSSSSFNKQVRTRSQKNKGKVTKQEEKTIKTKKKVQQIIQKEKQIHISENKQQLEFEASSVKPRIVRIHKHNTEQFNQLYLKLQSIHPNCTDWDIISLLELSYNNFDRAFKLLEESENFILYFLQVKSHKSNEEIIEIQEEVQTGKKK